MNSWVFFFKRRGGVGEKSERQAYQNSYLVRTLWCSEISLDHQLTILLISQFLSNQCEGATLEMLMKLDSCSHNRFKMMKLD